MINEYVIFLTKSRGGLMSCLLSYFLVFISMREKYKKKIVVRITENQFNRLQQKIVKDEVSMSQAIREAIKNKFNKIYIDDSRKRKFRH